MLVVGLAFGLSELTRPETRRNVLVRPSKAYANSKAAPEWAIFYILDEPTTGLRFQLLDVLQELVDPGNTGEGATGGEVKRSS
jgi:hypothetical protein